MAFFGINNDKTPQGYQVYTNNLTRELVPLFTRPKVDHKGTIDIFDTKENENKDLKMAIVGPHTKVLAPKGFIFSPNLLKTYLFLTQKIAQVVTSKTPEQDVEGKGLQIRIERPEWDLKNGDNNKYRSFIDLYEGLLALQKLSLLYQVFREGEGFATIADPLIDKGLELSADKRVITLTIPPKPLNMFIYEAAQRSYLPENFYRLPIHNPYLGAFIAHIWAEMSARHTKTLILGISDIIEKLKLNTKTERKDRHVITPIKTMVMEAQKQGYEIEYLTAGNTKPIGSDFTNYNRFKQLRLKIIDKRE